MAISVGQVRITLGLGTLRLTTVELQELQGILNFVNPETEREPAEVGAVPAGWTMSWTENKLSLAYDDGKGS